MSRRTRVQKARAKRALPRTTVEFHAAAQRHERTQERLDASANLLDRIEAILRTK